MGEFDSLMPHKIKVTSKSVKDDFTYDVWDLETERTYACLIDESTSIQQNADGVTLGIGIVAYVDAIPIGKIEPENILDSDKVDIILPVMFSTRWRPIVSIARHFWIDGKLDNLEVKLS